MNPSTMVLVVLLVAGLVTPALAQGPGAGPPGPMPEGMMGGMPGMHDRMGGGMSPGGMRGGGRSGRAHEGPLVSIMLAHREELGLTADQEQKLRQIRTEATKDLIRRTAELQVAEIDLETLLEQPTWDLPAIETKVRQIATLRADRRLSRLRSLAAGRALLTPEQLQKLQALGHGGMRPGPGRPGPARGGAGMGPDGGRPPARP